MRVVVTGASGFAGGWLAVACRDAGDSVLGLSRSGAVPDGCEGRALDLRDGPALAAAVREFRPDVVHHLAALSNVGRSWSEPAATVDANVVGAAALLGALRAGAPDARVVWVSSSEVYGTVAGAAIAEDVVPAPESPYAVSKLAAEQLAGVLGRAHGMPVVVARPFSHTGPGQSSLYLVSNLCRQAAVARRDGAAALRLVTGNPDVRRDFTDVRDVVAAYRRLAVAPDVVGGVFNVCTGVTRSTAEIVSELALLVAPLPVEHVVDPARVRAAEVMELRGDPSRLRSALGWTPETAFERTVADLLAFWDGRVRAAVRD